MSRARRNLFVLGHMRSYSSLLCHILGSHPQVDGYCETHIKYRTWLDLLRLRSRVVQLTGEPLRGRYILDKVLHNTLTRGVLFLLVMLALLHGAHRIRYTLYDGLQIKHLNGVINLVCYGSAVVGSIAALVLLGWMP